MVVVYKVYLRIKFKLEYIDVCLREVGLIKKFDEVKVFVIVGYNFGEVM